MNVEKVGGLAYLQIEIERDKIARYGINVAVRPKPTPSLASGGKGSYQVTT